MLTRRRCSRGLPLAAKASSSAVRSAPVECSCSRYGADSSIWSGSGSTTVLAGNLSSRPCSGSKAAGQMWAPRSPASPTGLARRMKRGRDRMSRVCAGRRLVSWSSCDFALRSRRERWKRSFLDRECLSGAGVGGQSVCFVSGCGQ